MRDFLNTLREFPEEKKKAIALFAAAGITLVLLVLRFALPFPGGSSHDEKPPQEDEGSLSGPLEAIGNEFNGAVQDVKKEWTLWGGSTKMGNLFDMFREGDSLDDEATSTTATSSVESLPNEVDQESATSTNSAIIDEKSSVAGAALSVDTEADQTNATGTESAVQ